MSYAVQTTHEISQEARAEQVAYEDKVIGAMLDAFDALLEGGGGMLGDRRLRQVFQDRHLEAAAMFMTMTSGTPRRLVASFIQLAGVWRDLITTTPEERRSAGMLLDQLSQLIRHSRKLSPPAQEQAPT